MQGSALKSAVAGLFVCIGAGALAANAGVTISTNHINMLTGDKAIVVSRTDHVGTGDMHEHFALLVPAGGGMVQLDTFFMSSQFHHPGGDVVADTDFSRGSGSATAHDVPRYVTVTPNCTTGEVTVTSNDGHGNSLCNSADCVYVEQSGGTGVVGANCVDGMPGGGGNIGDGTTSNMIGTGGDCVMVGDGFNTLWASPAAYCSRRITKVIFKGPKAR